MTLRVRWLGRVPYREALAVQTAIFTYGVEDHLLLLEHPHVFTHGPRADLAVNVLVDPASVGAELVSVKRGGDVTYHGPGQLVGYPIVNVSNSVGAADHVGAIQRVILESLTELGVADVGCLDEYPGVWVGVSGANPRKICAIGVRLAHGRTMHGFALNVAPDMRYMRDFIVPCGIPDKPVTSLEEEGVGASLADVADIVARHAAAMWGDGEMERQEVAWKHRPDDLSAFSRGEGPGAIVRRLAQVGVADGLAIATRKPEWLRPKVVHGPEVIALKKTVRDHGLVTVCEEAGCPNLSDCWADGTATFMVLGERCTRACGFCLVDTRKPLDPSTDEPGRVADAIAGMGLAHAVLTMVARDDLPDGGYGPCGAMRRGNPRALSRYSDRDVDLRRQGRCRIRWRCLFEVRPDVLNHNIETVARLQRAVRPSAGYARSLSVLALAKACRVGDEVGIDRGDGGDPRRDRRLPCRSGEHRSRHRHDRSVSAADHSPSAGRALGRPGRVRRVEAHRRVIGDRPRRGQPADAQQLPRPTSRGCGDHQRHRGVIVRVSQHAFGVPSHPGLTVCARLAR